MCLFLLSEMDNAINETLFDCLLLVLTRKLHEKVTRITNELGCTQRASSEPMANEQKVPLIVTKAEINEQLELLYENQSNTDEKRFLFFSFSFIIINSFFLSLITLN